jgi:hypothetical protein
MKRIAALAVLALGMLVVPSLAAKAPGPPTPQDPKPTKPSKPLTPHKCVPHNAGYNATGTLVSSNLSSDGDGRYSGALEVNLTRANHHAATGDQTFTLDHAKVKFHHGVDPTAPAPGSRVKLHGKITQLPRHCSTDGFTPTITVKKVDIREAKHQTG